MRSAEIRRVVVRYWPCWGGFIALMFYIWRDDIPVSKSVNLWIGMAAAYVIGSLIGRCMALQISQDRRDEEVAARHRHRAGWER